jgi:hypothetical protein
MVLSLLKVQEILPELEKDVLLSIDIASANLAECAVILLKPSFKLQYIFLVHTCSSVSIHSF